ncbi:peptidyl-tRNA hydrolase [candidate division MSBL1 archaeon SCGC-AAA385D11]|uniref:Peptidyl-tRNA hydrolase n=1 Tax=candidate division MSBL1 archaeon SCGC-AAA385D11 TaxID=1698286 RepID=A0A133VNS4_9EURY|nr:peptidyl-tRNA hydrolase [candidate division MSBL1 archaeon SCGC-AAA385D11]
MDDHKQVIAARDDLGMSSGKLAVQVAHGSVGAAEKAMKEKKEWFEKWTDENRKKVVVRVSNEDDLRRLRDKAKDLGVPYEFVEDAGLTELPPGTSTVLAVGPAPDRIVDKITGDLPLWRG